MQAKQTTSGRRVNKRYRANDRERLIKEQAESGLTKKAFCERNGINRGTFLGWRRYQTAVKKPAFAQVKVPTATPAAVEVLLPNGVRIGIRHQGKQDELVSLVRGVAGC
ncbi:MAG: transposase [Verrucomicrobia bacterium]|jgi:transposase-like protein|nr:transposase [Verrucomicrobiota bacterium]